MASLNDLELLESNNFIHLFTCNGTSPSLRLLREQKDMAGMLGEAGVKIVHDLDDPTTDLGKSYARLESLEKDMQATMAAVGITAEAAEKASSILNRNPASLDELTDDDRSVIQDYWIKKKQCIADLIAKKYTYQELFS